MLSQRLFRRPHVLHSGIVYSPIAQPATSDSVQLVTPGVSSLSLTPSVNMKIHRVPPHSIGASPLSLTPSVNTKIHHISPHSIGASPLSLTPG